jgi:hypothetical protein
MGNPAVSVSFNSLAQEHSGRHTLLCLGLVKRGKVAKQAQLLAGQDGYCADNGLFPTPVSDIHVRSSGFPAAQPTYLNRKIEEHQVPVGPRDDILIHHRHADRGQAVCDDGRPGAVVNLVDDGPHGGRRIVSGPGGSGPPEKGVILAAKALAIERPHLNIFILLVRHGGRGVLCGASEYGGCRQQLSVASSQQAVGMPRGVWACSRNDGMQSSRWDRRIRRAGKRRTTPSGQTGRGVGARGVDADADTAAGWVGSAEREKGTISSGRDHRGGDNEDED